MEYHNTMNTTQCPWPGLEPGPLDPEVSVLTMRHPCDDEKNEQ